MASLLDLLPIREGQVTWLVDYTNHRGIWRREKATTYTAARHRAEELARQGIRARCWWQGDEALNHG